MQTNAQCLGGVAVPTEILNSLFEDWVYRWFYFGCLLVI